MLLTLIIAYYQHMNFMLLVRPAKYEELDEIHQSTRNTNDDMCAGRLEARNGQLFKFKTARTSNYQGCLLQMIYSGYRLSTPNLNIRLIKLEVAELIL